MASFKDIRAGLAAAVAAAVPEAQCTGYVLSSPTPPFFDIELAIDGVEYDQAFGRGVDMWTFTVRGVTGLTDSIVSQQTLDGWVEGDLVKDAVEQDQTLGGAAMAVHVTRLDSYRAIAVRSQPNNVYLGAEWTVEIHATGGN